MEKPQHKKSIDQLLHDNSFILWCLFPTEESNKQWEDNYLSLYPEETETLKLAKEKICRLKFNHVQLAATEKNALKQRILDNYEKRRKTKYIKWCWLSAAACLLILCVLRSLYLQYQEVSNVQLRTSVLADAKINPKQKEVELHLSTEKIQVRDNSTISVDKQGNVQVAEMGIKSIDQKQHSGEKNNYNHLNRLSVPYGRRSSLILSDGTKVWINSGTVLQFPQTFEKDKRILYVNGEIYLEVAKNPQWPFYVKTKQMEVQVLGTSFGITAYDDEKSQSVVLKDGSVFIKNNQGNGKTIKPNQCLVVEKEEMTVKEVDVHNYISWINGVLQFHEKSLQMILNSLSRYYRVRFDCPIEIGQIKCSGNLVLFDDIDQVLRTLQQTLSISCSYQGEVIKIESTHK